MDQVVFIEFYGVESVSCSACTDEVGCCVKLRILYGGSL